MARVDPQRLCLIRATETILMPNRGAAVGGCVGISEIDDRETWVTAAESMQKGGARGGADFGIKEKYGADNRSYAARIVWAREGLAGPSERPAVRRILLLQQPTCRIPLGDPGEHGAGWAAAPALPEIVASPVRPDPPPKTTVRALAQRDALCLRFDCETKDPRTLIEGAKGGDRVWVEIYPQNDPVERLRFEEDFRGDSQILRLDRITGEDSLEVVPDVWEARRRSPWAVSDEDVPIYHGLQPGGWFAEFVIPWRVLGLAARPPAIGIHYGRNFGDTAPMAEPWIGSWPAAGDFPPWSRYPEPGQALLGAGAQAPVAWETAPPRFGANQGRLALEAPLAQPLRLSVHTAGPGGLETGATVTDVPAGATSADFAYRLDRNLDSHLDVFHPQRVVIDLAAASGARIYHASVPFGRHLGVCVDEPYGESVDAEAAAPGAAGTHEKWLQSVERALPRLERRTTQSGAPSDFCLVYENGAVAANLMADDAWPRLAAIVESRFPSAEERLVAAMALVGQKSVTNLFTDPLYFKASGDEYYHSAMVEMLGPLSIIRYGGGTAASRAAALARLLQHIADPATGRPFVTRVISLTAGGGPSQVDRHYPGVSGNLAPFVEAPGRIGAVAVDYHGSQTLLDPTALAFFPQGDRLATVEEIRTDAGLRRDGCGRLADAYGKIDIDEIRHEPVDWLLSRGVFPEQAPEEDGNDRPYTMGYRIQAPALVADGGALSRSGEFVDTWLQPGVRRASAAVEKSGDGWRITVSVRGVALDSLVGRDRTSERVHLLFDCGHTHVHFLHFTATAAGGRGEWFEFADAIQTFSKHLATENWREFSALGSSGWKARFVPVVQGYDAVFEIPLAALGLGEAPPVMGFNVWVDGRSPNYEELFLAPPRRRLPADAMSFADLYTAVPPALLSSVDLGVPTWMDNSGVVVLSNPGDRPATVQVRASERLSSLRKTIGSPAVSATVPAHGTATLRFPFFLDPSEKMETGDAPHLILEASADGRVFYRSAWKTTYSGPLSVYQRYGSELGVQPRPAPGDPYYVERMIRWMSARLPRFQQADNAGRGAKAISCCRAEDGSVRINLMEPDALDRMAAYVEGRFPTDFERLLALYCLDLEPSIGRHNSGGHHLMDRAQPISILRGNFSGGGGNCGFHSALFAGLAAHLRIQGRLLGTRTVSVWGHDIMALDWRGSRALMDNDAGNLFFTPDGKDFATIEEFRANPWLLSNAGSAEVGRYYSFSEEDANSREPGVGGVTGPGVFPEGQLAVSDQPGVP